MFPYAFLAFSPNLRVVSPIAHGLELFRHRLNGTSELGQMFCDFGYVIVSHHVPTCACIRPGPKSVLTLVLTGLRRFELVGPRWRHVNLVDGTLRVEVALTNLAATGASPFAVMATAGRRSMQTTKGYLHLAGVVFPDDASALEQRLLGVQDPGTNSAETAAVSEKS